MKPRRIDSPRKGRGQPFGTPLKQETARLCTGKVVTMFVNGNDRYDRTLGEIRLPDGTFLNQVLVRNGFAWRYKYSSYKILTELESMAINNGVGLWSDKIQCHLGNSVTQRRRKFINNKENCIEGAIDEPRFLFERNRS